MRVLIQNYFISIKTNVIRCWFTLICIVFLTSVATAQDNFVVEAVILDQTNHQPIPYVKVFNINTHNGTLTDQNGYFKLEVQSLEDTVRFAYVGYEILKRTGAELINQENVYLAESSTLLGTVNVLADDAYLYDLIAGCNHSKQTKTKTKTAKTYFGLETFVDNQQVELIECYYNGIFSGYNVRDLELKKGRSALNIKDEIVFVSWDISKAFYLHDLFRSNENTFPSSPFEFNKRSLRKMYRLSLTSKYKDELANTICAIAFNAKGDQERFFNGTVWIDSSSNDIQKVELVIKDAKIYPFSDQWSQSELNNVNMKITKTFEKRGGEMVLNAIYFDYDLQYRIRQDNHAEKSILRSTRSVLYVFDHDATFVLPYFKFPPDVSDYRKISASKYDRFFWENYNEFRMDNQNEQKEVFFQDADLTSATLFDSRKISQDKRSFFESDYIFWEKKRIFFSKNLMQDSLVDQLKKQGLPAARLYHLEAQIYMDIVQLDDTIYVDTKAVFDPFETYYYCPITTKTHIFINTYFDLFEISRRVLERDIKQSEPSIKAINAIYENRMNQLKLQTEQFLSEVDRGENEQEMAKWNAFVKAELQIDNIEIFSLPPGQE